MKQKYIEQNKVTQRERSRLAAQKGREAIRRMKNGPCVDCGVQYPYWIMHFDHVRGKKEFNISARRTSAPAALSEIMKCDLVCANCHADRTYRRVTRAAGSGKKAAAKGRVRTKKGSGASGEALRQNVVNLSRGGK